MTHAVDRVRVDLRQPRLQALLDFDPETPSIRSAHRQRGARDLLGYVGVEGPLDQARNLNTEECIGVLDCLSDRPGHALLEQLRTRLPLEAKREGHERG